MCIFTHTCCKIQYYLILITRGKCPNFAVPNKQVYSKFQQKQTQALPQLFFKKLYELHVNLQKLSQGYCFAFSPLLICSVACNQTRLQSNWQDIFSAWRYYWNAFNSQNQAGTSLLIYCPLCSENTTISVAVCKELRL